MATDHVQSFKGTVQLYIYYPYCGMYHSLFFPRAYFRVCIALVADPMDHFDVHTLPFQDENFLTCVILVQISSLLNHRVWMIPRRYRLGKHMHINGRDTTMALWRLPVIPDQYVNFDIKVQMHVSFWSILVVIHWLHCHFWRQRNGEMDNDTRIRTITIQAFDIDVKFLSLV